MEHSEESNCVTDTGDINPDFGLQSSLTSSNADPDAIPSDQIVKLHEELETKLYLEEAEAKDDQPLPYSAPEEEVHEEEELERQRQQYVKEDEEDKDSIGWNQDEHFNSGESNGGEEDHLNYNDKFGDEVEKMDELSNGNRRHVYPVRPEAEDCSFYMKTGTCKFGSNCKFNHPVKRKNQASKERMNEREQGVERPGQTECKYYLRTGGCKYGKACRYNHSRAKSPVLPARTTTFPVSDLNFLGLPIRPGERECPYYMRNGSCKYGANCRFNHPDPTAVGGSDPPSAFSNGSSPSFKSSSQSNVASWSSPRGQNETPPFMPIMFPPTQGVPSQSPEWNGYQAPVYPPERSMHPPPQFLRSPATDTNAYAQQRMPFEEFPERPGQPECSFYMKTGDCKYRSNCKYHHPKNHNSRSPPCILSDKGLPLRPGKSICSYYSRYGICKYGPACKFDHPVIQQPTLSIGSADDEDIHFGESMAEQEARMADTGNGNDTAIQQSV
ncbi:zinc finger CCCH domain-containing protein 43 [Euphorbia lathyris]|uniref:zinc finger CCCH domain-containing protein 43 n=1 Tax=Euphorbia lathyris TaxID=212925 RepID=UPI0033138AB0